MVLVAWGPAVRERSDAGFATVAPGWPEDPETVADVTEDESKKLHETFAVPGAGRMLYQAATANFNPWTDAKVDSTNSKRGPLLIISGEKDHTVPWAIANASYKKQKRNEGVTEIVEIPDRGHSLTIDHGWREVADKALSFVRRFE